MSAVAQSGGLGGFLCFLCLTGLVVIGILAMTIGCLTGVTGPMPYAG